MSLRTGKFITALILAGGSTGVNNLMVALGYRSKSAAKNKVPKPPPDKGWVAIRVAREEARARFSFISIK